MSQVAQLAACSQSTVSLVLNRIPNVRIGDETRRRVDEAARLLGYQVPWPRSRQDGSPLREIAMIVDRLATSPEAVVSVDGAREAAWNEGRVLPVLVTLSDPEAEARCIESLAGRQLDGLIYASIMTRQVEPPATLRGLRVVLLNCYTADRSLPAIVPGEVAGGQVATQRLLRAGHTRIAIVNGEMWMDAAQDRFKGYRRALATADIPFDPDLVREGNWEYGSGQRAAASLLALPAPPTAIFFANDRMAVGGYAWLREHGYNIPRDISAIGYDDQAICQELTPPLTSVLLPHREMGQWAVEWLLHEADRPHLGKYPIVKLDCPVVDRDSIGPPAR